MAFYRPVLAYTLCKNIARGSLFAHPNPPWYTENMLTNLSIRDVVLIKELDIEFHSGMTALTGETGSGKSILLDALGLALGMRADLGLIRQGAEKSIVAAEFRIEENHPIWPFLTEAGIDPSDQGGLVLRRILSADGKSRATANDQPISINLLRQIGAMIVEIHGQFDQHGLLNANTHRRTLDAFGKLSARILDLGKMFHAWRGLEQQWQDAVREQQQKQTQEEFLRHAITEITAFEAKLGEEQALLERRIALQHREKIVAALMQSIESLSGEDGADRRVLGAQKSIGRVLDKAPDLLNAIYTALERAEVEIREAIGLLQSALGTDSDAPAQLEILEDRLFALRDLARKYNVAPDALLDLLTQMQSELLQIDTADERIKNLFERKQRARNTYYDEAQKISALRQKLAQKLDRAVMSEMEPLKLGRAAFQTRVSLIEESDWGEHGIDAVEFTVATNPGMPAGSLSKIASGGELSRFMLALKVVLAETQHATTMIFDEIDSGIGGQVADAVGNRLEVLGQSAQILLVTHSPQVASKAQHHYRISKTVVKNSTKTTIEPLNPKARGEEIARMLSGASITDEARAAANKLLGAA